MNLEEFRKALSSDATEENARLKKQLSDLQKVACDRVIYKKGESNVSKI